MGAVVDPEDLTVLAAAVANHERLRLEYRARDGTSGRRVVEPHRLVAAGRRWYLVAYDNDRDDWRIFRVDRIHEPQPTRVRVPPR
jgi:predicted DNA-binding transcriptional regulator YafY